MAEESAAEAKVWLLKAWRDLETARRCANGEPPFYDIAVYHCQQAAEKSVKAFLVHHDRPTRKPMTSKCWSILRVRLMPNSANWRMPPMR